VGLNIATLIVLGGVIAWYIAMPLYSTFFLDTDPGLQALFANGMAAGDLAGEIWSQKIRYLGVGAMLVGGLWAVISLRDSLLAAIRGGITAPRARDLHHTERDVPMRFVLIGIALFTLPIAAVYYSIVNTAGAAVAMTVIMVCAGFLFSAVAAYMAGLVGSSHNPVSGITIATILFASMLLYYILGPDAGAGGAAAAIMVGAVVCCAAAIGGDNMQDLKAGYLVGATPWRQQVVQAVGVVSAVLVMAPILNLLLEAYGFGAPSTAHPNALAAPQATLMQSVAEGVFSGTLPWNMVASGAAIGVLIILIDEILQRRGSTIRAPVLAVAVGIYLPLELSVPIFAGGLIAHWVNRRRAAADSGPNRPGILFAAGLITGEALVGIAVAVPIVATGNSDVLALGVDWPALVGLVVLGGLAYALYRVARQ
jgi:putative OPT family oligopeptide transporter